MTDYFKPVNPKKSENEKPAPTREHNEPTSTTIDKMPTPIPQSKGKTPLASDKTNETKLSDASLPPKSTSSSPTLTLTYHKGDIFAAPPQTLLIHACNTQGSWGAGIAAAFRTRYPAAYKVYRDYCLKRHDPKTNPIPTGTCLLIPPCETTNGKPKHWIGCLFTSAKYGKAKDKPDVILSNTAPAMKELLGEAKTVTKDGKGVGEVRMCMINSARFGVPWERTVEVLEGIVVEEGWADSVEAWSIE
ncbi:hypothetical protein CC80DRAFT_525891 [Byssothecium circinans]|uniref:ADP-ribose 1''-phosphate phosphatase n=1 Tax=Byssothecium circinans TaxID=147558 RepID=A0A6A5TSQ9_9PLEO|nr:hypothetical protein CC80DRAFT_525891 [Byssothecium circinans]